MVSAVVVLVEVHCMVFAFEPQQHEVGGTVAVVVAVAADVVAASWLDHCRHCRCNEKMNVSKSFVFVLVQFSVTSYESWAWRE